MAARHSAFYSPLLATLARFLVEENLTASYKILPPRARSHELVARGEVDIVQSAVSSNWVPMEKGTRHLPLHFAQINRRDGFFLTGREADPSFRWKKLEGKKLLADHGLQPLAMLRYAAHCQGADWGKIELIDVGAPEEIDAAFRAGRGDYAHQQGPAPQQLEKDRAGHIVACVGEAMPPLAFSSLAASPKFLATEPARSFLRAYAKGRAWVVSAGAEEIAAVESSYFRGIGLDVLAATIARYQKLGCWGGDLTITRQLYERSLDVFVYSSAISRRHPYHEVVVSAEDVTGRAV